MRGYLTDPDSTGGLRLADDLSEPDPADDELVLDVRAFSLNRGELALVPARPDRWRPGQDVAGVVARAAADGSGPAVGDRVVGAAPGGGWSEQVAVSTAHCAVVPDDVELETAAALPIAGLTAMRALRQGGLLLGRRVLVTGATGAVGQIAVQLALASGAHVTAQISGAHRRDEADSLGPHVVVEGTELGDDRFDLVADGVGGDVLTEAVHRLEPGATAVTYGVSGGQAALGVLDFAEAPNARVVGLFHHVPEDQKGADLAILVGQVARGALTPRLGLVDDWTRTVEAMQSLADRQVVGKAVLRRS